MKSASDTLPDSAGAIKYAIDRLRAELPSHYYYHNVSHTEKDVLPAASRLAKLKGLSDFNRQLLEVAAAFHDLGLIKTVHGHEKLGVKIMAETLPGFGFNDTAIERIAGMIMATRLPQSPVNTEQQLLVDADLDSLGREDFFQTSKSLFQERLASGIEITWQEWLDIQLEFMQEHTYFSDVAKKLRNEGKIKNIELLKRLIKGETIPGVSDI